MGDLKKLGRIIELGAKQSQHDILGSHSGSALLHSLRQEAKHGKKFAEITGPYWIERRVATNVYEMMDVETGRKSKASASHLILMT